MTRTIVSTDDAEIARRGAEPRRRGAVHAARGARPGSLARHRRVPPRARMASRPAGLSSASWWSICARPAPSGAWTSIDRAIEVMLDRPEADSLRSVSWPTETPYKMWRIVGGYLEPLLEVAGRGRAVLRPAPEPARSLLAERLCRHRAAARRPRRRADVRPHDSCRS